MNSMIKHTQAMMNEFFGQDKQAPKHVEKCLGCYQGSKSLDQDGLCMTCARKQREMDEGDQI